MQIDKLAVELRPRSTWEAIDLGVRMVQAWARPLYRAWLSVFLPAAVLIGVGIGYGLESPTIAALVIWLFKPLFDSVALHVLGSAVFGEMPSVRATWRAVPRRLLRADMWRLLALRLLPWIWWFNTQRSLLLPVMQLEGMRGKSARERRRLLARQVGGAASWLTITMMHFEIVLLFALIGLVALMLPASIAEQLDFETYLFSNEATAQLIAGLLFTFIGVATTALLEPFYVACGFALYLSRRTDLEAWDVELAFRRVRDAGAASARAATLVVALALTIIAGSMTPTAEAAAPPTAPATLADAPERAREKIGEVYQRPEFGSERSKWRWKYIGPKPEASNDKNWIERVLRSIGKAIVLIGKWIATVGRMVAWLTLAGLLLVLTWALYHQWQRRTGAAATTPPPPAEVAGFDIRPESLPTDIAAAALKLARSRQARACLSLLYRATLSALAHRERVDFLRGDTEGDCLRRVRATVPPRYGFFSQLTTAWQEVAYACHEPSLERLEALCQQWPEHFAYQS
ncbi:MAG: DUF4129 domain-containing protein [Gammaproteobacteria bacterium]|nr:DUF4129 domain-containing protein [Gammaproteobacteria bacterium]